MQPGLLENRPPGEAEDLELDPGEETGDMFDDDPEAARGPDDDDQIVDEFDTGPDPGPQDDRS